MIHKANRRKFSDTTIKALFALTGNECAMPNCFNLLVNEETKKVRGIICHIEAESGGGPRYNQNQTNKEREDFSNLVILCRNCHWEIDTNPQKYTVEYLYKIKKQHEEKFKGKPYHLSENMLSLMKVSINEDEFSLEQISLLLDIY